MKRLALILIIYAAHAEAQTLAGSGPISGYDFMEPTTQQLQDDDFINPAFFLVDRGLALWDQTSPTNSKSCGICHQDIETDMYDVSRQYPKYDTKLSKFINLEMKINSEIVKKLDASPLAPGSEDLLALTSLIGLQSRGLPMASASNAGTQPWIERGKTIYKTKRGQLNLSCADCHQDHWGDRLRGDTISQGQINAFPIFRLIWGEVGSLQRMFSWCMNAVRSEPYSNDADEYLALEAFLTKKAQGLAIETPGVRR